jgi:hypothetical protein
MADISIQFHALPDELRDFVKQCVTDFNLHVIAMRYVPFEVIEPVGVDLDRLFIDSSMHRRLHFTLEKPTFPVAHALDFGVKNQDALRLDIGARTETELRESWLCARTNNATALAVWRKIAKRLKDMTEKGALAVQPKTGQTGPVRGHRYTLGAKELESSGVFMLTQTGIILKLGQLGEATTGDQ